jgi:hypothetical protein
VERNIALADLAPAGELGAAFIGGIRATARSI